MSFFDNFGTILNYFNRVGLNPFNIVPTGRTYSFRMNRFSYYLKALVTDFIILYALKLLSNNVADIPHEYELSMSLDNIITVIRDTGNLIAYNLVILANAKATPKHFKLLQKINDLDKKFVKYKDIIDIPVTPQPYLQDFILVVLYAATIMSLCIVYNFFNGFYLIDYCLSLAMIWQYVYMFLNLIYLKMLAKILHGNYEKVIKLFSYFSANRASFDANATWEIFYFISEFLSSINKIFDSFNSVFGFPLLIIFSEVFMFASITVYNTMRELPHVRSEFNVNMFAVCLNIGFLLPMIAVVLFFGLAFYNLYEMVSRIYSL